MRNAWAVSVVFTVAIAATALAQSTQNPPRVEQPPAQITQTESSRNQTQTPQPPIIVNISPAPKTDAEREQEANDRREKANTDRKLADYTGELAFFTKGLFVATVALGIATIGLLVVAFFQSRDMKASIAAAQSANAISQQSIIADKRAWITVGDLEFDKDLIFQRDRGDLPMSVRVRNIGKTPAHSIHTQMEMIYDYAKAPDAVKSLSEKVKTIDEVQWTRTLLPGDSYRRRWGFTIEVKPEDALIMFPVIIGCTTYRIAPDQTIHQTTFVFHLFECESGQPSKFIECIRPHIGMLPKDRIGWDGGSGAFAD